MKLIGRELTEEIDRLIQARIERREADRFCASCLEKIDTRLRDGCE